MSEKLSWFQSEVFQWRLFATVTWTVIFHFSWIFLSLLLLNIISSPLHPLHCVAMAVASLLTPSSWIYNLIITLCLSFWTSRHYNHFSLTPCLLSSWFSLLSLPHLSSLLHHILLSLLLSFCHVQLLPGTSDSRLFLVLCGCLTGSRLWSQYQYNNDSLVVFPAINQNRYHQVRQTVPHILWSSSLNSLLLLRYYYPTYILLGHFFIMPLLGVTPLPPISSYLDLQLFLNAFLISLLLHLSSSTLYTISTVYLTSSLHLPLSSLLPCLDPVLPPLLTHLSLRGLTDAVTGSDRSLLFTLSQPGGHPHNWTTLSSSCLSYIDKMSSQLADITNPRPPPPPPPASTPAAPPPPAMRRLAPVSSPSSSVQDLAPPPPPPPTNTWWTTVKKKHLSFLFSPPPDHRLGSVLCQSQPVVWSLQILSHVVAASLTEDRFGVVQNKLPTILTSLLSLEANIERAGRGSGQAKKGAGEMELKMMREVRWCVKSAIYRIVVTFGDHILSVPLDKEWSQKMKNYHSFMEA